MTLSDMTVSKLQPLYCRVLGLVCGLVLLLFVMAPLSPAALAQSSVRLPAGASGSATPPPPPAGILSGTSAGRGAQDVGSSGTARNPFRVPDPTAGKGARYDTRMWEKLRKGAGGTVSILDSNAGQLIQSDGWEWMKLRNGKLQRYGGWALGGTIVLLAAFFLFKGRIKIASGWAGRTVTRFGFWERAAHWMLAGSFIILAVSGLNMLYGKELLLPLIGKPAFAAMTAWGKSLHNYVAFAFMVGILMTFVMWLRHNFPSWRDIVWVAKLGGALGHVSAGKFNAGQKMLFWLIMLSGFSISATGLAWMFPFQAPLAGETFWALNRLGTDFPTTLSAVQDMQYTSIWHSILGLFMSCLIIAHIYIGTIGMQGAFAAMGSGEVDENWALEHHDIWAKDALAARGSLGAQGGGGSPAGPSPAGPQPAE